MKKAQTASLEQMSMDEVEMRKKSFRDTIRTENVQKISLSVLVGIIFMAYFI
jgi:hypothetical protein